MIIFLDFDGVVVTAESYLKKTRDYIDKDCMEVLRKLYKSTNSIGVVISSDWRNWHSYDFFRDLFDWYAPEIQVLGRTERDALTHQESDSKLITVPKLRGQLILEWIKDKGYEGPYLVIDDCESWILDIPQENKILVKDGISEGGLQEKHIKHILDKS